MGSTRNGRLGVALALLLLLVGAGCAGFRIWDGRDDATRLKARVAEYWEARIRGDLVQTYQLHEPGFRRAVTLTGFMQGRGVTPVFEYTIEGVEIKETLGIVKMKIRSSVVHPMLVKPVEPRTHEFEEQWVRVDGQWYRKFRFPVGEPYRDVDWDEMAEKTRSAQQPR